jgi:HAD superfamily hydrolase (TIGR01549 family)
MPSLDGFLGRQLWLFDFDNTLAALEKEVDWRSSRRDLECFLRTQGVDESLFLKFPTRNLPLYNAILARQISRSQPAAEIIRQASAIIELYELRGAEKAAPLKGAAELMLSLNARGKRIAIVTSNSSRTVHRWLHRNRLAHTVSTIIGRDDFLPLKPSPMMISRALEHNDLSANEAVMVGDSEADAVAARHAQVDFLGIAQDGGTRARLHELGAYATFSSPGDLAHQLFGCSTSSQEPNSNWEEQSE